MKTGIFRVIAFLFLLAGILSAKELPKISLMPLYGPLRGHCKFDELVWKEESGPYLRETAPVCRSVEKPRDISKVHELAKSMGLKSVWDDTIERQYGKRNSGVVVYRGLGPNGRKIGIIANPKTRQIWAKFSDLMEFEWDGNQNPILKPLIPKEQAIEVCREWMKKFGIKESELYQEEKEFHVEDFQEVIRKGFPETVYPLGLRLYFAQQVGGIRVQRPIERHDEIYGLEFMIDDDGTLSRIHCRLNVWEKIADYPILSKEEIIQAIQEQFYWRDNRWHDNRPFVCDRIEVFDVELLAHRFDDFERRRDFPLFYRLHVRLKGGLNDGEVRYFKIPALRQHRHSYGPFVFDPRSETMFLDYKPVARPVEK